MVLSSLSSRRYLLHFDVGNFVHINDLFVCLEIVPLRLFFEGISEKESLENESEGRLMCQDV